MIIAVDASGGDYAPQEIVKGAIEAALEYDIKIVLLGDQHAIDSLLKKEQDTGKISTINTPQTITCNEHPVQAVRSKPDSSIVKGIQMVKDGLAAAFVSAGNTGAVLASAFFLLNKLEGIERPAIGVVIPVPGSKPFLLLDAGANSDCQPRYLMQFARLGDVFARLYLGIESPRIGLLNNGEEEVKGSNLTIETYKLIKKSGLNFIGNVEGQDILKGKADVLVTDGFTGNIVLKSMEGFVDLLQHVLALEKGSSKSDGSGHLSSLIKGLDFSEYGGSCLLGLRGNVVICHGRSNAKAMKNAIRFAFQTAGSGMVETITKELNPGTGASQS